MLTRYADGTGAAIRNALQASDGQPTAEIEGFAAKLVEEL